ncbi:MAG: hypothetical protein V1808_01630 [Candidatus Daviesbacteria bacterium]
MKRLYKTIILGFILSCYMLHATCYMTAALAAESTQSASPSSSLQTKLKALQEEIASKAAKFKAEVTKKLQNKAFVGIVKSKSETSLTIATTSDSKIINLNEYTQYSLFPASSKKKFTFKNLLEEDNIAALGDVDDNGVLTAKKIVKLTPLEEVKKIIMGEVVALGDQIITLKQKSGENIGLLVDNKTDFQSKQESDLTLSDVKLNSSLIAVGINPKNGVIRAKFIYLLPSNLSLKVKLSSPSAQIKITPPKASPSAQVKKK